MDPSQNTGGAQGYQRTDWYAEHPKRLAQGQLSNADATLYAGVTVATQPPNPKVRVTEILLTNTDSSDRTVTLQIRSGASSATTHILSAKTVAANDTLPVSLSTIMEAGELISGLADTGSKVNYRISGVELLTSG